MPEAGTTVTPKRLWRGDVIVTEVSVTPPIEKLPEPPGFFNIERPTAAVDPLLTNTVGSGFNRELTREVFRPFSSRQGYAFLSLSHNDTGDLTVDNCSMSTFVVLLRADADSSPTPTPPRPPPLLTFTRISWTHGVLPRLPVRRISQPRHPRAC